MNNDASRREFMQKTVATAAVIGGAATCACALGGCAGKTPKVDKANVKREDGNLVLDTAGVSQLGEVGGSVCLDADKASLIVVRTGENEYVALSNKCTHFGRAVDYDAASGKLVCCSFGHSAFALDGSVLKGPAKKPLKRYETAQKDGKLVITL